MKLLERVDWLIRQAATSYPHMDVLNRDFVDDYVEATGAKFVPMILGANRCRRLGSDLSDAWRWGYLKRHTTGLRGMEWGFPKWVYSYSLTEAGKQRLEKLKGKK